MTKPTRMRLIVSASVLGACCSWLVIRSLSSPEREAANQGHVELVASEHIVEVVLAAVDAAVPDGERTSARIADKLSHDVGNIPGQDDEIARMTARRQAPTDLIDAVRGRRKNVVAKLTSLPVGSPYRLATDDGELQREGGFVVRVSRPVFDRRSRFAICLIACSPDEPTGGGVTAYLLVRGENGWQVEEHAVLAMF